MKLNDSAYLHPPRDTGQRGDMAIMTTQATKNGTDCFSNLKNHQFMNLTTFRKSGTAVSTPVWFAQDGSRLVMTTSATAGKAKRIRNNPHVELAPSDMRGKPLGDAVPAQARILQGDKAKAAEKLLRKKYGLQWTMFGLAGRNDVRIFIEITPP